MALPDWHDVALNSRRVVLAFDGDMARKPAVQKAIHALAAYLAQGCPGRVPAPARHRRQDRPRRLPDGRPHRRGPVAAGEAAPATGTASARASHRRPPEPPRPSRSRPITLDEAHAVFRRWLGDDYDLDALDAVLAAAAVERLDGDPLWLLVVSGSGNAKTETVQALDGVGADRHQRDHREGALLSATPEAGTRQGRDRRAAAQDRRPRRAGHQGRDVDPVDEPRHPRQGARRAARGLRRPVVAQRRHRRRADPRMDGPHRRHRRRHHRLGHRPRRHRHHGRPVRPGPHGLHHGPAGGRAAGDRQHRRRDRRCAPSWPRRWPASSPA